MLWVYFLFFNILSSFVLIIKHKGNDQGEIFIYDFLNVNKNGKNDNGLMRKYDLGRDQSLIRKVIITEDKNILFAISDRKKLYKLDLTSDLELMEKIKLRNIALGKK